MCDWHTDNGQICGQSVAELQTLILEQQRQQQQQQQAQNPQVRLPLQNDDDLWKTVFCPVLATAIMGFLASEGITPGDLVARFTPMGPGEAMPRLLQHTNLLAPLYVNYVNKNNHDNNQSNWWNAGLRLLVRCCDGLLTLAVQNNVVQQHVHPHAGITHWVWCRDLLQQVYAPDEEAMLAWVDERLYAVAAGQEGGLTEHFLTARIRQIEDQLGDLALVPPAAADQTPRQQRLIQEVARLHREALARAAEAAATAAALATPPPSPLGSSQGHGRSGVGGSHHRRRRRHGHRRLSDTSNQNQNLGATFEENATGHLRASGKWIERMVAFHMGEGRLSEAQRIHEAAYGRFT